MSRCHPLLLILGNDKYAIQTLYCLGMKIDAAHIFPSGLSRCGSLWENYMYLLAFVCSQDGATPELPGKLINGEIYAEQKNFLLGIDVCLSRIPVRFLVQNKLFKNYGD